MGISSSDALYMYFCCNDWRSFDLRLWMDNMQNSQISTSMSSTVSPLYSLSTFNDNSEKPIHLSLFIPVEESLCFLSWGKTDVESDQTGFWESICVDIKEQRLVRMGSGVTWLVERMNWLLARYVSSQKISGFSMFRSFAILRSPRRWLSIAIPVIAWKIYFQLWLIFNHNMNTEALVRLKLDWS